MMKITSADSGPQMPKASGRQPRLALAIATVGGVGYLPKAPGTFGSLVGVGMASLLVPIEFQLMIHLSRGIVPRFGNQAPVGLPFIVLPALLTVFLACVGVWSSTRVAVYAKAKDPQHVVIDEVSGQHLALLLGLAPLFALALIPSEADYSGKDVGLIYRLLNWKCLLLGFILFRVFDIWKPWPIRRLEKLPGGWGIMADDWMAGIYAAILLRVALHFNLV
jgi:phosphatidylglycerophosphatase A